MKLKLTQLRSAVGVAMALGAAAAALPAHAGYSWCDARWACETRTVSASSWGHHVRFSAWNDRFGHVSRKRVYDVSNFVNVYSRGSGSVWGEPIRGLYGSYRGAVSGFRVHAILHNYW